MNLYADQEDQRFAKSPHHHHPSCHEKKTKKIVPMVSPMLIKHQLIIFYCLTWDPIYPSFLDKIGLRRIMYNTLQGDWVEKPKLVGRSVANTNPKWEWLPKNLVQCCHLLQQQDDDSQGSQSPRICRCNRTHSS